jgi:hypothetical protein
MVGSFDKGIQKSGALYDAITKETRRRNADDREGMRLNIDRGVHNVRVATKVRLPCWVTKDAPTPTVAK